MKIGLAVHGNPGSDQSAESAWLFANAVVASGHVIPRIFFYLDGVHHGSSLLQDPDWSGRWQQLAAAHHIELIVCVAAAEHRGVLDVDAAARRATAVANLAPGFLLSGLGQLVESATSADRFVTFGP